MQSCLRVAAILGLVLTSLNSADARRRSRIDSPIEDAADAPLEDNLATASDVESIVEKYDMPLSAKEQPKVESNQTTSKELIQSLECNSDNLSFELITGYSLIFPLA